MSNEFHFTSRIASILYDDYVLENLPITELRDALSAGQVYSKKWLALEFHQLISAGTIFAGANVAVLGGWIGTLPLMFESFFLPLTVTSIDIDERANRIAEKLNYTQAGFKTMTMDMYDVDYRQFNVIVNTSSEHIPDISAWRQGIPSGKIVAVQNNNMIHGDGHISCVSSTEQLIDELQLSNVLYSGKLSFPEYERYMVIGRS
jgi:hypothetical protein